MSEMVDSAEGKGRCTCGTRMYQGHRESCPHYQDSFAQARDLQKRLVDCDTIAGEFYRSMAHPIYDGEMRAAVSFGALCLAHADRLLSKPGECWMEIKRLRAEVERLREADGIQRDRIAGLSADYQRERAEVERLREALAESVRLGDMLWVWTVSGRANVAEMRSDWQTHAHTVTDLLTQGSTPKQEAE